MKAISLLQSKKKFSRSGFTLIELMVVIAIILVLATFVVGGMGWYKRKAAIGKTTILLGSIERALEDYRVDNGIFPTGDGGENSTQSVYKALYGDGIAVEGGTIYLDVLDPNFIGQKRNVAGSDNNYTIVDAWGEDFRYQSPGEMNPKDDFDLWSLGPDSLGGPTSNNKKDKADDIKNW